MTQAQQKEILPATAAELVTVENLTPAEIFTPTKIDEFMAVVKKHIDDFKPDASTEAGRDEIKSFAFKITKSKTLIEKIGDKYAQFLKDEPKKVDKERKRWKDTLDAWAKEVRAPVTAIEEADKLRKDAHQQCIDKIGQALTFTAPPVTANVVERIKWVEAQKVRAWDEFKNLAESTISAVLESLKETHAKAVKADEDAAELERLRKEKADRDEQERIKEIADAAAAKARQDLLDEQSRAAEVTVEVEKVTVEHQKPQVEEEKATVAPDAFDAANVAPPVATRESMAPKGNMLPPEVEHKARILREVLASLLTYGTTEAGARALIGEILKGKIKHVTINFGEMK